jgi:thioredoxin-like negative regulator of GroEL
MLDLNEENMGKQLAADPWETTLVMFRADWCPFCRKFWPVFESYESAAGRAGIRLAEALVNEDENPMWDRFRIEAVPTLVAFRGRKEMARRGAKPGVGLAKADLDSILKELKG